MSKYKSLDDLVEGIYSRGRFDPEENFSKHSRDSDEMYGRIGTFFNSRENRCSEIPYRIEPEENDLSSKLRLGYNDLETSNFEKNNEKIYNPSYSGLEKIIQEDIKKELPIINYLDQIYSKSEISESKKIEYIIEGQSNFEDILSDYESIGYRRTKKEISPEIVIPEISEKRVSQPVEVTRQGLPAEYKPILNMLAKKFSGVRYKGMEHLERSQHNVDILTFEYEVDGQTQQVHLALKDRNDVEERLPIFLQRLGISVHSIYDVDTGRAFVMQHVGDRSLRQAIQFASEADIRSLSEKALETIAQVHVLATAHLPELKGDFGVELATIDYTQEFRRRFLEPVSNHSVIISPQMDKLIQAYAAFAKAFTPNSVIHGDYHDMNCRVAGDVCYPIDWETAAIGKEFDDVSRLANSIMRDRPDMDAADFTREVLIEYVEKHNESAGQEKMPLMLANEKLAAGFRYSMINDEIYKIGEYVSFGKLRPAVKEEKMQKSRECFEKALRMIDGAIETADKQGDYFSWETLNNLRQSLVDYVGTSPIESLREAAEGYNIKGKAREPLLLVPA